LSINTLEFGGVELASTEVGFAIFLLCYFFQQLAAEVSAVDFVVLVLQSEHTLRCQFF